MDNLDTIFGIELSPNPGAQCLHRAQVRFAEKLLEHVEAGVVSNGNSPLCRPLRRPVANIRQCNPKIVLAMLGPQPPAVVFLNQLGELKTGKVSESLSQPCGEVLAETAIVDEVRLTSRCSNKSVSTVAISCGCITVYG